MRYYIRHTGKDDNDKCTSASGIRISRRARVVREAIASLNKQNFIRTKRDNNKNNSDFDRKFSYPKHLKVEKIEMENFRMEMLSLAEEKSDRVILQLHGGGYVGAFKNVYRTMAGLYSEVSGGANVLTIDYRVAPMNPYPCALEDAFEAYEYLLDNGYSPRQIYVAGDSAGGGLALSLCHYLKDNGVELPRAIITMSPWADLTASGPSYKDNYDIDPLFGNESSVMIFDCPYPLDEDPTNKYISPMFGEFDGFPPMLIQVGTDEMLFSDSEIVADKAEKAGVKVRLSIYEGMFHVFQMGATIMPESMKAWSEIGSFIRHVERHY